VVKVIYRLGVLGNHNPSFCSSRSSQKVKRVDKLGDMSLDIGQGGRGGGMDHLCGRSTGLHVYGNVLSYGDGGSPHP
jgi:hypothetical protein